MTVTNGSITGQAIGDDFDIVRTVDGLPDGVTVTKAWLMVKRSKGDADADAVVSKTITTVDVAGTGQVTNDDDMAELTFQIRAADTDELVAEEPYLYGIKVKLSNGLGDTVEVGVFVLGPAIVQARL